MQHNLTVTMKEAPLRGGGTGLSWNVTSSCRLKGEVQLCKKDPTESQCEEVMDSRQKLQDIWVKSSDRHWVKRAHFSNAKCLKLQQNAGILMHHC